MSLLESIALEKCGELKNPAASAQVVGLRYVSDSIPGIRREKTGKSFRFRYPTGDVVRDEEVLKRIKSLAIPPAWRQVWICPDSCGHLQATGRDDRGRKQSRYHPRWREVRDEAKYARMITFGKALPNIRQRVLRDLALPGLPRNKVLATIVRLLELSLIRVGNNEYARENDSFGLTTMRDRHVEVSGSKLCFRFRGKSGRWHDVDIRDRHVARIVKNCQDLPGQELFQYLNEDGKRRTVGSEDVNEYLRKISGHDFTAKDFRTWAGTVLAVRALQALEPAEARNPLKKHLVRAIETVAEKLGNTTTVCRKCYVHPEVFAAYMDGSLLGALKKTGEPPGQRASGRLSSEEAGILEFLQKRLAGQERRLERELAASLKQRRQQHQRRGRYKSAALKLAA